MERWNLGQNHALRKENRQREDEAGQGEAEPDGAHLRLENVVVVRCRYHVGEQGLHEDFPAWNMAIHGTGESRKPYASDGDDDAEKKLLPHQIIEQTEALESFQNPGGDKTYRDRLSHESDRGFHVMRGEVLEALLFYALVLFS